MFKMFSFNIGYIPKNIVNIIKISITMKSFFIISLLLYIYKDSSLNSILLTRLNEYTEEIIQFKAITQM